MTGAVDISRAAAITGWMSEPELTWLAERAQRSRCIVEIGSYQGRSTRALADHTEGIVYAVDPWTPMPNMAEYGVLESTLPAFEANLSDHLATGRVRAMPATFEKALVALRLCGATPDLIFIDGDHEGASVWRDVGHALELLMSAESPAVLAGHDYGSEWWPDVKTVVDTRFGSLAQFCDSIWWVNLP